MYFSESAEGITITYSNQRIYSFFLLFFGESDIVEDSTNTGSNMRILEVVAMDPDVDFGV